MKTDARLIQHIHRPNKRRPERGGEVDPLRLSTGERARKPVQRQVSDADIVEVRKPPSKLAQDPFRDLQLIFGQREPIR